MGVPKLFRWLVERYPLTLSGTSRIPVFDLNGVIHKVSHGDEGREREKTEKEIIFALFNYLERIFNLTKPQKLFFIAIDGVAPRAKANQQRQRRFKAAHDRLKREEQLSTEEKKVELFDSNCITPGTEFMQKLTEHLKFWIQYKIDTDSNWQNITVILSGAEVPGEGEHKIAEYIRNLKSSKDYDSSTTHCLYGLDADLIMLSLASHEPYFSILREKVVFRSRKQMREASNKTEVVIQQTDDFQLLSISLLREYLEIEFKMDNLPFPYNLERVIGNDFLPCIPFLEIDEGGLAAIFAAYKELLPTWKGYLVNAEKGKVRLESLIQVFSRLSERESKSLYELNENQKELEAQLLRDDEVDEDDSKKQIESTLKNMLGINSDAAPKEENKTVESDLKALLGLSSETTPSQQQVTDTNTQQSKSEEKESSAASSSQQKSVEVDDAAKRNEQASNVLRNLLGIGTSTESTTPSTSATTSTSATPISEEEMFIKSLQDVKSTQHSMFASAVPHNYEEDSEVKKMRRNYYKLKLQKKEDELTEELITEMCTNYLEGLIWTLNYYYHGHLSWSWFYSFFAAPFASDMKKLSPLVKINFEMEKPFTPFQQLLAVLPPQSSQLLPKPYQKLMLDDDSPLKPFFPDTFEFLHDDKGREWRDIALIPFIDQNKLIQAVNQIPKDALTEEEHKRNSFGKSLRFTYDAHPHELPTALFDITSIKKVHCKYEEIGTPEFYQRFVPLPSALYKQLTIPPKQFPTLRTRPFKCYLKKIGVNVVGTPSRTETLVLALHKSEVAADSIESIANHWIGRTCFMGWPYHLEAKIVGVSNEQNYIHFSSRGKLVNSAPFFVWNETCAKLRESALKSHGIDVGPVTLIFHLQPLEGMQRSGNFRSKKFSNKVTLEVAQRLVMNSVLMKGLADSRYEEAKIPETSFRANSPVIFIGVQYFGSTGRVISRSKKDPSFLWQIELDVYPHDPHFGRSVASTFKEKYFPAPQVAESVSISPLALSRITGQLLFKPGSVDLGLGIKYSRRELLVAGYVRKLPPSYEGGKPFWEYSEKAMQLIQQYKAAFPELFEGVNKDPTCDVFDAEAIFGEKYQEKLNEILQWLSKSPHSELPLVPSDSLTLNNEAIAAIEQKADEFISTLKKKKHNMTASLSELLHPSDCVEVFQSHSHTIKYELGDRVVATSTTGCVPFGLRGTVISVQGDTLEILFDEEFLSGTNLHGRCKKLRGATVDKYSVMNLTHPFITVTPPKKQPVARAQYQPKVKKSSAAAKNPFDLLNDDE